MLKYYILKSFYFFYLFHIINSSNDVHCGIGSKLDKDTDECIQITNNDILASINWLALPPRTECNKISSINGINICEDNIPKKCVIWSVITSYQCDDIGDLKFEKYWATKCDVIIYHFTPNQKELECEIKEGKAWSKYPRLFMVRNNMWEFRAVNNLYRYIKVPGTNTTVSALSNISTRKNTENNNNNDNNSNDNNNIDDDDIFFLKLSQSSDIQNLGNSLDDGSQYTIISDLLLNLPQLANRIQQISMVTAYTPATLTDK